MRLSLITLAYLYTLAIAFTPDAVHAQDITDTLYYDVKWQLCERTPATYYRIGTLRIDSLARYIGLVTDYYMNGQVEMKATYDNRGDLQGPISFFYENGQVRMQGQLTNGKMTGIWSFYQETGKLRAIMNCKDEMDFAPVFLSNERGKVIMAEGDRTFRLETADFEGILAPAGYRIKGELRDGLREGTWEYSTTLRLPFNRGSSTHAIISEEYVRGKFIRAITDPDAPVRERRILNKPFGKVTLYPQKLLTLDMLRSDFIFAPTKDGRHQLRAFLVAGRKPVIEEAPSSPDQNFALLIRVFLGALQKRPELAYKGFGKPGKTYNGLSYEMIRLGAYDSKLSRYHANIRFTILGNGTIGDLIIDGKIDDRTKELITYYLMRIRNLYVNEQPVLNHMVLTLKTHEGQTLSRSDVITLSRITTEDH